MKPNTKTDLGFVFIWVGIIALMLATPTAWVVKSYFEAKSYNLLTGAHATTWDAMWAELRVQDKSTDQKQ